MDGLGGSGGLRPQKYKPPRGRMGATVTATGGKDWVEVCRLENTPDEPAVSGTLYSAIGQITDPTVPALPHPRVMLKVIIGSGNKSGGSTVTRLVPAGAAIRVSGKQIVVSALITTDERGIVALPGNVVNANVTAPLYVFLSEEDGGDLEPTQWCSPLNSGYSPADPFVTSFAIISRVAIRIKSIRAYHLLTGVRFLMFFDTVLLNPTAVAAAGLNPIISIPFSGLGDTPPVVTEPYKQFELVRSAKPFQVGCMWAVSSTGDVFTYDNTAKFNTEVELYSEGFIPQTVF